MRSTPARQAATVTLLDDDLSVLRATGRLLDSAGWSTVAFSDPHAFLSHARANSPALAVLDVRMPAMDGLEVQRRLREGSPGTRVIFLSSVEDATVQANALAAGAAAFFRKPVDDDEFLDAIEAAITAESGKSHQTAPQGDAIT